MNPPKHAFEVKITIGANTREYIERALEQISFDVSRGSTNVASGGWDGSYSFDVAERDIAPDAYRDELQKWMDNERSAADQPTAQGIEAHVVERQ
jgi:hypothetical protein